MLKQLVSLALESRLRFAAWDLRIAGNAAGEWAAQHQERQVLRKVSQRPNKAWEVLNKACGV
jgi:hypothetical protein